MPTGSASRTSTTRMLNAIANTGGTAKRDELSALGAAQACARVEQRSDPQGARRELPSSVRVASSVEPVRAVARSSVPSWLRVRGASALMSTRCETCAACNGCFRIGTRCVPNYGRGQIAPRQEALSRPRRHRAVEAYRESSLWHVRRRSGVQPLRWFLAKAVEQHERERKGKTRG